MIYNESKLYKIDLYNAAANLPYMSYVLTDHTVIDASTVEKRLLISLNHLPRKKFNSISKIY